MEKFDKWKRKEYTTLVPLQQRHTPIHFGHKETETTYLIDTYNRFATTLSRWPILSIIKTKTHYFLTIRYMIADGVRKFLEQDDWKQTMEYVELGAVSVQECKEHRDELYANK